MRKRSETIDLQAQIAEKRNAEERLAEVRKKLSEGQTSEQAIARLSQEAGDLRVRVESLKVHGDSLNARQREDLKRYEGELETAVNRVEMAKKSRSALVNEETALKEELAKNSCLCGPTEFRECQDKLQVVLADIDCLNNAIKHQEEVIEEARSETPDIAAIKTRQQDLLADMALGKGDQKALDGIEKDMAKAVKAKDASAALIKQAETAIAGLRKQLAGANAIAETLQVDKIDAACHYLVTAAMVVDGKYRDAAEELATRFTQLKAISELIAKVSKGSLSGAVVAHGEQKLFVPAFGVGASASLNAGEPLLSREKIKVAEGVLVEQKRFQDLGVDVF